MTSEALNLETLGVFIILILVFVYFVTCSPLLSKTLAPSGLSDLPSPVPHKCSLWLSGLVNEFSKSGHLKVCPALADLPFPVPLLYPNSSLVTFLCHQPLVYLNMLIWQASVTFSLESLRI